MKAKNILYLVVFLALLLVLLVGGHYLLYYFFIDSYNLYLSPWHAAIAVVFGIFSVGYIFASVIARWSDNLITRIFYAATAVWLGFIWYVTISVAFVLLLFGFLPFLHVEISHAWFSSFAVLFAVAFTIYGLWSTYHPRVKEIRIQIKDLPQAWNGKKIVQVSDVHLGHIHGEHFFHKLVSLIRAQNPDAVCITGDLFDGMGGDFKYIVEDINRIEAPLGIFYIKGNHETYMDFSKVEPFIRKSKAVFLCDEIRVVNGLQIAGADYPPPGEKREIGHLVSRIDQIKPSILLWHEPIDIETAKRHGVSLVLSGHTHRGQVFPFEAIARKIYKQYEYGYVNDGNFHQYTSSGFGTWGPPIRTGNHPEIVCVTLHKAKQP